MKILFQGDSITDAFRKPEEVSVAYQLGNGYAFLAAAELACQEPGRGWEFVNRGVSGAKIKEIAFRWQDDALALQPDLVSLLAGVNDTIHCFMFGIQGLSVEEFASTYDNLLARVLESKPDSRILLMEPFLLEVGEVTAEWKAHLRPRQEVVAKIASDRSIPCIPLQKHFDEACRRAPAAYWAYDGIHPTLAGARLIADFWLSTFRSISM